MPVVIGRSGHYYNQVRQGTGDMYCILQYTTYMALYSLFFNIVTPPKEAFMREKWDLKTIKIVNDIKSLRNSLKSFPKIMKKSPPLLTTKKEYRPMEVGGGTH